MDGKVTIKADLKKYIKGMVNGVSSRFVKRMKCLIQAQYRSIASRSARQSTGLTAHSK